MRLVNSVKVIEKNGDEILLARLPLSGGEQEPGSSCLLQSIGITSAFVTICSSARDPNVIDR